MNEIIRNMPDAEYHAIDRISNSRLSRMLPTPAHCKEHMDNPPEATDNLVMGRYFHALTLEPDSVAECYIVQPKIDRRTKKGKADYENFLLLAGEKQVVKQDMVDTALAMRESIILHPAAGKLISESKDKELTLLWDDDATGAPMKAKLDAVRDGVIIDLKSCDDASPKGFQRSIAKYGYHRQAALYSDAYTQVVGEPPKGFVFIAVEKKPPYAVACYVLSREDIARGLTDYRELLVRYVDCEFENNWHGYSGMIEEIELPKWF